MFEKPKITVKKIGPKKLNASQTAQELSKKNKSG